MVSGLRKFDSSEIAKERLKIIRFYDKHGEKTTKEAFGVGRKTIHVWKKRLELSNGKLIGLIPSFTRPHKTRRMTTNPKITEFIKSLREKHPRLGKEKIYPLLLIFCKEEGITPIKESTIGKVIKRNNLFHQKQERIYHNPNSKFAKNRHKTKRLRTKHSPKPEDFGYIQMDTVVRLVDGVKYYFYSAIDTKGKFALFLPYRHLNSRNTVDFFKKLVFAIPFTIRTVQTDNGLEFLGEFERYLKKSNIKHIFTYPRCPRINGVVERYNRSIQEEFINYNFHLLHDKKTFSLNPADYLLFYNCQRVHKTLSNKTPMDYLFEKGVMSKKSVTYTLF